MIQAHDIHVIFEYLFVDELVIDWKCLCSLAIAVDNVCLFYSFICDYVELPSAVLNHSRMNRDFTVELMSQLPHTDRTNLNDNSDLSIVSRRLIFYRWVIAVITLQMRYHIKIRATQNEEKLELAHYIFYYFVHLLNAFRCTHGPINGCLFERSTLPFVVLFIAARVLIKAQNCINPVCWVRWWYGWHGAGHVFAMARSGAPHSVWVVCIVHCANWRSARLKNGQVVRRCTECRWCHL